MCRTFQRIEIRGKKGRTVPVLLPPNLREHIEVLLQHRQEAGVHKDNKYLFPRSSFDSLNPLRSADCLRRFANEADLSFPENLTSTKLRKHVATISQVLDLSKSDLENMANFLGHDIEVHRSFYRIPQETLQVAKMGRLLTAFDNGTVSKYSGKPLDEIPVDEAASSSSHEPQSSRSQQSSQEPQSSRSQQSSQEQQASSFGVYSTKTFTKGSFILEYAGERRKAKEFEMKKEEKQTYVFHYKWNGEQYVIDATHSLDRLGRYVNDEAFGKPANNSVVKLKMINKQPRLCLFASRDIYEGEEIRYDYGDQEAPWRQVDVINVLKFTENLFLPFHQVSEQFLASRDKSQVKLMS
ncbi:hypothetical protein FSP39_000071 [Pinctada imbricata]|uniref:SET domain-containing protein n=1 Tax=Pinctada imbricata TaxID=66713 RepID=A0AA89CAD0_PINIB|nr:hypothetical protein FSP39_000071 [Pinctada imbricata]